MPQFVNEPFTGTPGDNLTAINGWAKVTGATGDAFITSGGDKVRFSGATLYYLGSAPAPGADYSATINIDIVAATTGPGVGVAIRLSATAQTYYLVRLLSGTGIQMYRVVNGTSTLLGSASYTAVVGNTLSLRGEASGSTINAYIDGAATPAITASDSGITTPGYVGLRAINATTQLQPDSITAATPEAGGATGTFAPTLSGASMAANGIINATGAAASTLSDASMSAAGVAGGGASSSFATTLAGASMGAFGALANSGSLATSLAGASMAASGLLAASGAMNASLAGASMLAGGSTAQNATAVLDSSLTGATMYAGGYVGEPPELAGFFQRLPKNPRHLLPLP